MEVTQASTYGLFIDLLKGHLIYESIQFKDEQAFDEFKKEILLKIPTYEVGIKSNGEIKTMTFDEFKKWFFK